MVSYQTIARYDDDGIRKCRSKSIDDIRHKAREALHQKRYTNKCLKMLRNRPTLAESILLNLDEDDECAASESSFASEDLFAQLNTSPDAHQQGSRVHESWLPETPPTDQVDLAPATHWPSSASGRSTNSPLTIDPSTIPPFFFETPESSHHGSPGGVRSSNKQALAQRHLMYKNLKGQTSKNGSFCDHDAASRQLDILKESIRDSRGDLETISTLIQVQWQVLFNALKSSRHSLASDALFLLKSLAQENLIQPHIIMHMLQHGLVFVIRDTMLRCDDGLFHTVHLFLTIARTTPASIPYMIDLMSNSKVFADFEECIVNGTAEEAEIVIEFYHLITETMFSHLYIENQHNHPQIMIPEILRLTGVSKQTVQSYSPVSTLTKCVSTDLIRNTVNRFLSRLFRRDDALMTKVLLVLANILKLIHFKTATQTCTAEESLKMARLLAVLRDAHIETKITDLISSCDRLVKVSEFSEHSSQGVGVGSIAVRITEQCQQFLTFYKDQYAHLSLVYDSLMSQWETGYQTPKRSDSWDMD